MTEILGGAAYNEHFPFGRTGRMNRTLENRIIDLVRHFDLIITMGSGAKRFLESRGIRRPIEIIPGGIDDRAFSPNADQKVYDLVVTCRLVPVKRLDIFLNVVREISRIHPSVRAVIVGDGEQRNSLSTLAASLGLTDRVVFAGSQADVTPFLRKSRLFLLTSDSEGLALSLMEAMMCGLPAVASDVGDLSDLVKNGVNGWLVPRRNISAFSEKIVSLLADPKRYQTFSRLAREHALAVGLSAISARWERILRI
jgi:glycosyltransferase involved in cell wall biosynthesis